MIVSLIVAMDEKRGIGFANRIPWHLSTDLKRFKSLTMDHHIIVGRKTYESIGRHLPGRTMIILTRDRKYQIPGCYVVHSFDEAVNLARGRGESEVFVIGGAEIFTQALDVADRIYLTQVHTTEESDTFFPDYDQSEWVLSESSYHKASEVDQFPYTFNVLVRKEGD